MNRAGRLGVGIVGAGRVGPVIGAALGGAGHAIVGITAGSDPRPRRRDAAGRAVPRSARDRRAQRARHPRGADEQLADLVAAWPRPALAAGPAGAAHGAAARHRGARARRRRRARSRSRFTPRWRSPAPASTCGGCRRGARGDRPAPVLPIAQALVVEMGGEPVVVAEADRAAYAEAIAAATEFSRAIVQQSTSLLRGIGIDNPGGYLSALVRSTVDQALTLETRPDWEASSGQRRRRRLGRARRAGRPAGRAGWAAGVASKDDQLHRRAAHPTGGSQKRSTDDGGCCAGYLRRAHRRTRPHDGRAARRPPRPRRPGPRARRHRRGLDLRQPAAVRRRRGLRGLPAHPDADRRCSSRSASTSSSPRASTRCTGRPQTTKVTGGRGRRAVRGPLPPGPLRRGADGRGEAAQHRAARMSRCSAQGCAAGLPRAADGARPEPRRRGVGSRPCATTTVWRSRRNRLPRRARPQSGRQARRRARGRRLPPIAASTPARRRPVGAHGRGARRLEYLKVVDPGTFLPVDEGHAGPGAAC